VIALAFILAVVLFLGAVALVPDRLPRPARLLVIAATPLTALGTWIAVRAFEGWPLASAPPADAAFVAADVHEPDWIYLWLEPKTSSRPRAYRVRYSDGLYAQVLKAQQQLKNGQKVRIQRVSSRRRTRGRSAGVSPMPAFELRAYREPPVQPPRKHR
jgi:hypothetical protein